jgi:hypothetical protein
MQAQLALSREAAAKAKRFSDRPGKPSDTTHTSP